jgi:hypothetical protein
MLEDYFISGSKLKAALPDYSGLFFFSGAEAGQRKIIEQDKVIRLKLESLAEYVYCFIKIAP